METDPSWIELPAAVWPFLKKRDGLPSNAHPPKYSWNEVAVAQGRDWSAGTGKFNSRLGGRNRAEGRRRSVWDLADKSAIYQRGIENHIFKHFFFAGLERKKKRFGQSSVFSLTRQSKERDRKTFRSIQVISLTFIRCSL